MIPVRPVTAVLALLCGLPVVEAPSAPLEVGFAEVDVTPPLGGNPVFLAGFGHNRRATGVHDPIMARAVVLRHDDQKIALVSVDVVGLFHPYVVRVREQLKGLRYVLICSTHNHEGPDTLGLWGESAFKSGVDAAYMRQLEKGIVRAVEAADAAHKPVRARIGTARAPDLLHDGRLPILKHDELVALELQALKDGAPAGLIVQWNCHPETLGDKNSLLSADFVGRTVQELRKRHKCPVLYLTGTVGGLMTSLHVDVRGRSGELFGEGTYSKNDRYGELLADVTDKALSVAKPVTLTPFEVRSRSIFLPMTNPLYRLARQLKVVEREAFTWTGDPYKAEPAKDTSEAVCLRSEVAWLRVGELEIAAVPGEIYPELVLGGVEDPAVPGADFPDAPVEPAIYKQLSGPYRLIIGLANDEIGYIIPKRQWDEKPPYCYDRKTPQYGEVNSLGPDTAPVLCEAFRKLVRERK
jgi:hypothetical protein